MDELNFNKKVKEKEELEKSEKEIQEKLNDVFYYDGNNRNYKKYGLLDYFWYQKYKDYLFNLINGKTNDIFHFEFKEVDLKVENKFFCFINQNQNYNYNFIINFKLVTQNLSD